MSKFREISLKHTMQEWVNIHSGDVDWPDIIIGSDTAECMAKAAISVLDACLESQQYGKQQGYFK